MFVRAAIAAAESIRSIITCVPHHYAAEGPAAEAAEAQFLLTISGLGGHHSTVACTGSQTGLQMLLCFVSRGVVVSAACWMMSQRQRCMQMLRRHHDAIVGACCT
jgi:hypothetical protein